MTVTVLVFEKNGTIKELTIKKNPQMSRIFNRSEEKSVRFFIFYDIELSIMKRKKYFIYLYSKHHQLKLFECVLNV